MRAKTHFHLPTRRLRPRGARPSQTPFPQCTVAAARPLVRARASPTPGMAPKDASSSSSSSSSSSVRAPSAAAGEKVKWIPKDLRQYDAPVMGARYEGLLGRTLENLPLLSRLNWLHIPLLVSTPLIALYGIATSPLDWRTYLFAVAFYFFSGLGITAGECAGGGGAALRAQRTRSTKKGPTPDDSGTPSSARVLPRGRRTRDRGAAARRRRAEPGPKNGPHAPRSHAPRTPRPPSLTHSSYFSRAFSLRAGYHRHFAHRAYKATAFTRGLLLLMGAAAVEGSAKWWSRDHRAHHRCVRGGERGIPFPLPPLSHGPLPSPSPPSPSPLAQLRRHRAGPVLGRPRLLLRARRLDAREAGQEQERHPRH
jgi:hypothetical protein